MRKKAYDGLCISSGGYKGFGILGALAALEIHGYIDSSVKKLAGCSVGSIIVLLMACGWKPIELYKRAVQVKLFNGVPDINLEKIKKQHGILSNDPLRIELENLILLKRAKLPTLLDLHHEGYYLAFSICDRLSKKGYKLDYRSHPLLLASDAAMMSSNIPLIFPPIHFEGMEVVDGALCDPFPLSYIDNGVDYVLGIAVYGINAKEVGFLDAVTGMVTIQIEDRQRSNTEHASAMVDVLEMQVIELNYLNPDHSYKIKNRMFFRGYRDGGLLVAALDKKRRREKRRLRRRLRNAEKEEDRREEVEDSDQVEKNLTPGTTVEKIKSDAKHNLKGSVRTPLRQVPESVLLKCLMSQPLDLLLQIAARNPELLKKSLGHLDQPRLEKLKVLARLVLADEIKSGVHIKIEEPSDHRYETSDRIKITENHSQKIYDVLPREIKVVTKAMVDAMGPAQAEKAMTGINVVVEGLKILGIDIFGGLRLTDGSSNFSDDRHSRFDGPTFREGPIIEIIDEEDFSKIERITGTNSLDKVD